LKVALVHDWLTGMRGGERVLEAFCEIYPGADLFTLLYLPGALGAPIEDRTIHTSFIQSLPLSKKHYRMYLPLFPMAVERFDFTDYDLVISLSHCVAKGVITPADTMHISYIFTPMRYIWDRFSDYFGHKRYSPLISWIFSITAHYLRIWDTSSASRVDSFLAISDYVARRVKRCYGRDASVIYPPVDCGKFSLAESDSKDYYLLVSAFAPYKRVDIAISAFKELGLPLKIVGSGQDEKRLKAMAAPNIEFLGHLSDREVARLYRDCKALVFPGEEDFGITPLEAMASGRPVIAFARGGALETVVPLFKDRDSSIENQAPTGMFFYEQTTPSLVKAVKDFELSLDKFKPRDARKRAEQFSREFFMENIRKTIAEEYKGFLQARKKCSKNTRKFLKISSF